MSEKVYISCLDYTVSNESFDLIYNNDLDLLETNPKPSLDKLPKYYESDSYISHTDSKKSLVDRIYQRVKKINIDHKYNLISSNLNKNKTVLDIGCGTGDFLKKCSDESWNTFGVEPNSKARELSQKKIGQSSNEFLILESLESLIDQVPNQKFDVITMWHVLEHVYELEKTIEIITSLLKENGQIIIAVPNYNSYDANYYKEFWAAFDVPRHLWHFSKNRFNNYFQNLNLKWLRLNQ